jgi:hypothetical protein
VCLHWLQTVQQTLPQRQGLLKKLPKESRKPPLEKEALSAFQKRKIN